MYGRYVSNSGLIGGRNAITFVCKRGYKEYLHIDFPPEVFHLVAVTNQSVDFRFTEQVTIRGGEGEMKWVALYDSKMKGVIIEFPDRNSSDIKRKEQFLNLIADDFIVQFSPELIPPIPYTYLSEESSESSIKLLERFFEYHFTRMKIDMLLENCSNLQDNRIHL